MPPIPPSRRDAPAIQWGYERIDCRGDFALSLFLDDMERLLAHYVQGADSAEVRQFQAQAAANKLLQAYQKNARATQAFTRQSIEIRSVANAAGQTQFVPIFSAGLKACLMALLKRSNDAYLH